MKCMENKQKRNYARMLSAALNKFWKLISSKQQLYDHLPPISQTLQVKRTKDTAKKSKDELISDGLWWIPTHGRASVGRAERTCICCVRTLDLVWRTCQERWMTGMDCKKEREREREKERERVGELLPAWCDDDDNDSIYIYIYIYT